MLSGGVFVIDRLIEGNQEKPIIGHVRRLFVDDGSFDALELLQDIQWRAALATGAAHSTVPTGSSGAAGR